MLLSLLQLLQLLSLLSLLSLAIAGLDSEDNKTKTKGHLDIYANRNKKTSKEKYIGVTISADWKVSEQCGIAAKKGNQLLGNKEKNLIIGYHYTRAVA